jgi:ribosomal-protein-alanine N-acetyltransferase
VVQPERAVTTTARGTPAFTIEALTLAELRAVRRIDASAYVEPWSAELWDAELARGERCYLVARRARLVVGFVGAIKLVDEAHVLTIATHRSYLRQGVASQLLAAVFRWAMRSGCTALTLEVRASNVAAQELYRRFGMAPAGVRRGYYEPEGEDALIMWAHDIHTPAFAARLARVESRWQGEAGDE